MSTELNGSGQPLLLEGVKIIAVEQYGAGPFGTQHLADLGAEVIKIENRNDGGDVGRHVGPHYLGENDSQFYQSFNRNKKSITVNLKTEDGKLILSRLAKDADAVFNNLRGDLPSKLGLDYNALKEINSKIVCAHLSAYGREGSRTAWPGYDYLMQAEAGYLSVTGEPNGPPVRMGLSIIDLMTGTTAALGLLAGILSARSTGIGRDVDVSLFDVALHNLAYVATWYLNADHVLQREPRSSHPSLTPSQLYRTKDGWIFLMCNKEKFWSNLCEKLGKPEWIAKEEYKDFKSRLANRETINKDLDGALSERTTDEWMSVFAGAVPAAPVHDVRQALESNFVQEQNRIIELDHPTAKVRAVASPIRAGKHPNRAAPSMGEHNAEVLRMAGFTGEQIEHFIKTSVV